ncbi:hypothetical protein N431DRAFT_534118 [Stipitochalara longipes BDJ]|nr:hypothetical protein N431DRAFT_534118 [Stipitochalara longipes BDJ]
MAGSSGEIVSSNNHFQYAIPITIESLSKGFVAHNFWVPKYVRLQLKTFYRALYAIDSHSPTRRITRRLPTEIINIIAEYMTEAAVDQGFHDCEQRMGALKSSANLEIEESMVSLEKWGRSKRGLMANVEGNALSKFMMKRYALFIMPGMIDFGQWGALITHLFLCCSASLQSSPLFKIQIRAPSDCLHSALLDEKTKRVERIPRTVSSRWTGCLGGTSVSTLYVLEKKTIEKALFGDEAIGKSIRELRLEVVALI